MHWYTAGVIAPRLLFLLPLASALFADQVILKNGDILTGSIVKKDGGKLTIKSEFLGEVSMPWSAVQSIKSDEPLTVELPGEERVFGKVTTSGETLQVTTTTATRTARLGQVGALRNPAEQRTWERLRTPGFSNCGPASSIWAWRWRAARREPTP